jgi:hypothetical protein
VDHAILNVQPSNDFLDVYKLGMIECERCHEKFRPLSPTCHPIVVPRTQKTSW